MDPTASDQLLDYLDQVMYDPAHAALDLHQLPEDLQPFARGLVQFAEYVMEATALAGAIAKGNLDVKLPSPANEMAAPLKSLHATLKHLTWQTQQVAKGDYQQRVDFMGDFSAAFGKMTEQLELRRSTLLREIENWKRENNVLMQNKSLYEMLVGEIEQWIVVADADTAECIFVSQEMDKAVLGNPDREVHLHWWLKGQIKALREGSGVSVTDLELPGEAGIQYYSVSSHAMRWHQREAYAFVFTDVSREKEQINTLQGIASYDAMTQVYNRYRGMQILGEWVEQKADFILCFADIDNLKFVNDRFGHFQGDQYIVHVAQLLREFSPDAVLSRIGGDEFMLLAQNWNPEDALQRLQQLRERLVADDSTLYRRSISFGVIPVAQENELSASALVSAADEKMYEYKRAYKMRLRGLAEAGELYL